jgi:hypothetical protein
MIKMNGILRDFSNGVNYARDLLYKCNIKINTDIID